MNKLPFTTSENLKDNPLDFLCVSQNEINRIVTLQSSGTTGKPKRLFFTEADQELTIDFFHHGMLTLVRPEDRVLIMLPGEIPGSVGDLLRLGLERAGVIGVVHGLVTNPEATIEQIKRDNINVLVGIPTQVLSLVRFKDSKGCSPSLSLRRVLLSTDYVPQAIVQELESAWGCKVFNHYGMTEMGLGGGVECEGFCGYHLREADLYIEIIDPNSGRPVVDGQPGEIVFTTLTRSAMPLIRYRTGDMSRFLLGPCACHSVLKRLELIKSRERVYLSQADFLTMADFDEVLFALDNVLDFEVTLTEGMQEKENQLQLDVQLKGPISFEVKRNVHQALDEIPVVREARQDGSLRVFLYLESGAVVTSRKSTAKRQIQDKRGSVFNVAEKEDIQAKASLAAIIVAAGYSFRMKRFKPLLSLGGSTVLEQAVHSFQDNGIRDIRVVVGHRANELFPVIDRLGVQTIVNPNFSEGMFSSVTSGVKSLSPAVKGFFLLPVDNPIVKQDTLEKLQNTFFTTEFGIIYPSYQGKRGHPPLISCRYVNKVMTWNKPGGMRALLEQYEHDAIDVEVDDLGVLLDMDTPEDYQQMLKYCGDTQIPSEEECYAIIKKANTPVKVFNHCKQVAQLSSAMGSYLIKSGCQMNLELIRAAALLHDLAKGEPHHAQVGAKMLVNYPEVAEIVAEHTDICLNPADQALTEKEIVYLADKLVIDDQIISLQVRFSGLLEQNKNDQEVFRKIRLRLSNAERIQTRIEQIIKMPLHDVWKVELGGQG